MKMELLAAGGELHRPLIRLFDYQTDEVNLLRLACLELAYGRIAQFALHEQPWCNPIGDCQFFLRTAPTDIGIEVPNSGGAFVTLYSKEAWLEVEGKLWPFSEQPSGFNWLTFDGEVGLLISLDGRW